MASESGNERESPNMIVTIPNPVTAKINAIPGRCIGRRWARLTAMQIAPMDGAARNHPRPAGRHEGSGP